MPLNTRRAALLASPGVVPKRHGKASASKRNLTTPNYLLSQKALNAAADARYTLSPRLRVVRGLLK